MGAHIPAMERVPEPELMEGREQAAAYAAADFSASDGAVVARLGELFPEGLGPRVIDLGCGPGRIIQVLAPRFAEVHGVDVSDEMLRLGRERMKEHPNVQLHRVEGTSLKEFPDKHFQVMWSEKYVEVETGERGRIIPGCRGEDRL